MNHLNGAGLFLLMLTAPAFRAGAAPPERDWTHFVRIAGHSLAPGRAGEIVRGARDSGVFGIETDNDITGRYDSFLDPAQKLKAIRAVAEAAHADNNKAFVYIAGLECITDNAPKKTHSFFKDHPDWVQRKITGEPAVFGGGSAFWIREGDEDVWISPFALEWRKIYMERVRQIAATGIDGVYVDIPYWMTHFDGWEDTWASFDDYTLAAFRQKTGLDAKKDIRPGDYNDPGFRQWLDFRIEALTDFMREIDANVKAVNPRCRTIAEIYPGIEGEAVRVGADVYDMYRVVDVIAHEYEFSGGSPMAASKTPRDWLFYMTGMYTFRAFAEGKASWMLSYSWDGEKGVDPKDAMQNLFAAQLMAGANSWDARGHVMSGSNHIETRKEVFRWIAEHERTFYLPRTPIQPVGVYFSPATRNYFPEAFIESYRGVMALLLESHMEFQVVTPRTLGRFSGPALILPDVRCLGDAEIALLREYAGSGKLLLATGETGRYDERRNVRAGNPIQALRGTAIEPDCPGKAHVRLLAKEFDLAAAAGNAEGTEFDRLREQFAARLRREFKANPEVEVTAPPFVVSQTARVDGRSHVFLANFAGLKAKEVAVQRPVRNVTVAFPAQPGAQVYLLPFLGKTQRLEARTQDGKLVSVIPEIRRGAVVWVE